MAGAAIAEDGIKYLMQLNGGQGHAFEDSKDEFERLLVSYKNLGHEIVLIPKRTVEQRADVILQSLPTP